MAAPEDSPEGMREDSRGTAGPFQEGTPEGFPEASGEAAPGIVAPSDGPMVAVSATAVADTAVVRGVTGRRQGITVNR